LDRDKSHEGALRDEIVRLRSALQQAEREATVDPLTGCLNRRGWARTVEREELRCRRHGLDAIVVMVDLDGLKEVNDRHGHAAGDRRIVECASAISSVVRGEDLVARLGGDEFGVLAVQATDEAPQAVHAQIQRAFDETGVAGSLGWALRSEHDSLEEAVATADRRMLEVKERRRADRVIGPG
jgi:diguanylate cyclase (GGDEF)-like protein